MDGFGGYKTAATEQLPEVTAVMDPFRVVALAGANLDICRRTQLGVRSIWPGSLLRVMCGSRHPPSPYESRSGTVSVAGRR